MVAEINTDKIYKQLKKQNGEKFAQAIRGDRDHDGNLLVIPDILHILEFAGNNEDEARQLRPVLKEIYLTKQESQYYTNKDPLELLSDAGYDAFVVKNEKQKNSIKKYYRSGEEICTLRDPHRHENYYMIHAIKRGADKIKPSRKPEREDEYGTSVISIQIAKTGGFISIKNRYNHTISDPDATFNNNPDNIIPGLTNSLKKYFDVDFTTSEQILPENFRIIGKQFVHFNYEINNVYYDEKHYFQGSRITKLNPDYEIMLDSVILDKRTGKVRSVQGNTENLSQVLNNEMSGQKVKTKTDKTTGEIIITITDENKQTKELARTKNGYITSLHLYKTTEIGDRFLDMNYSLKELYAPKLKKMGAYCFYRTNSLEKLYVPELEQMAEMCFYQCSRLQEVLLPKLKKIGACCFENSRNIKKIYIPELEEMKGGVFSQNDDLKELYAPKLKKMGIGCFCYNAKLKTVYIPELEELCSDSFANVKHLKELIAPRLKKIFHNFTYSPIVMKKFVCPELEEAGQNCFDGTKIIQNLYAPKLKITKDTPKCILRAIKLTKFKEGIKNTLGLPHHNPNENSAIYIPDSQNDI